MALLRLIEIGFPMSAIFQKLHSLSLRSLKSLVLLSILMLAACGGGSSEKAFTYAGVWDVRYNLQIDDCGLARSDVPGINDRHFIEQSTEQVSLSSQGAFIRSDTGEIREDGTLFIAETLMQDVFSIGVLCELRTEITYSELDVDLDSANTLLSQTIDCSQAGFFCESVGIGTAARVPNSEDTTFDINEAA